MIRWPVVVLSALTLTTCTTVQEAYHTGARDGLTALEAEVQAQQATAGDACSYVQYRLPVLTQVTVPAALVGGVLIPVHQTSVVLQPGAWVQEEGDAPRPRGPGAPDCHPLQEHR